MAGQLGWKDILRPIRDGYRHIFPSPDTGPTPEERQKQRQADQLKGFTYFDTFEQLEAWTEADANPYQRANTPLLKRHVNPAQDDPEKAEILLVHDYAGNYHDYENARSIGVTEEMYSCEYLQFVDTFVYFSHKLVCVPPPSWINLLHRNGVRVLGSLIFEPQTAGLEQLLRHTTDKHGRNFDMAIVLASISKRYGFDGWLVNIEKVFPNERWDAELLEDFLGQLRKNLDDKLGVIWYDALTISNKVSYQNTLNRANVSFAAASGGILTNYCWTDDHAETALNNALSQDNTLTPTGVFLGVDVWAQNISKLSQPRVTYPEFGGGGTNTGVAVAKLAGLGLSVGVFAPAWSFEHFPGHGRTMERAMWEGSELPDLVSCDCGDCQVRHRPNENFAILKYAREFPAGSDRFFQTDFSRAFSKHAVGQSRFIGDHIVHTQLSSQSVLPLLPRPRDINQDTYLISRLENMAESSQLAVEAVGSGFDTYINGTYSLPLYKLDMPANESLRLTSMVRPSLQSNTIEVCFYVQTDKGMKTWSLPNDYEYDRGFYSFQEPIGISASGARIKELGVLVRGRLCLQLLAIPLLEILSICIAPIKSPQDMSSYTIDGLYIEPRQQSAIIMGWNFHGPDGTRIIEGGIPYSSTTGPFAYFRVHVNGFALGRVYALEFVLPEDFPQEEGKERYSLEVEGFGFDGGLLAKNIANL